eukprot:1206604-Amphidinium_carterae.1
MPSSTGMSFSAIVLAVSSAALSPGAAVLSASASASVSVALLPLPGLWPAAAALLAVFATAPPAEPVPELVAPLSAVAAPPELPA